MEDKEFSFSFYTNFKQFILLPYIGISWEYNFQICMMWAFFNFSFCYDKDKKYEDNEW
jgi:hypothetical protein